MSAYGNGRNSTPSSTLKIAVVAPMPRPSVSTTTAVKPGLFRNVRTAYRTSCHNTDRMVAPLDNPMGIGGTVCSGGH